MISKKLISVNTFVLIIIVLGFTLSAIANSGDLLVNQTLPEEIFQNDGSGKEYEIKIENSVGNGITEDIEIEIHPPLGFSLFNNQIESIKVVDIYSEDSKSIINDISLHNDNDIYRIEFDKVNPFTKIIEDDNTDGNGSYNNKLADKFIFAFAPTEMILGQTVKFTVQVQDEDNNPTTNHNGFNNIVSIVNNGSTYNLDPDSVNIPEGSHQVNFSFTPDNTGTYTIQLDSGVNSMEAAEHNIEVEETRFDLHENQRIEINYKLVTADDAGDEGDILKVKVSHRDNNDQRITYEDEKAIFVLMKFGDLSVDINFVDKSNGVFVNPRSSVEGYRDDELFVKVEVENVGSGPLFDTTFENSWGSGFNSASVDNIERAVLVDTDNQETDIKDSINIIESGYKYNYSQENQLKEGEKFVLVYSLFVEDRDNHNPIRISANNDVFSNKVEETVFFTFRPRRPEISITPPDTKLDISYEEAKDVKIIIENSNALNHGPARDFKLYADIPTGENGYHVILDHDSFVNNNGDFTSNGKWKWDDTDSYFEYIENGGNIPQGESIDLEFKLKAKSPQSNSSSSSDYISRDSGVIYLETQYKNDEEDIFYYPVDSFRYKVDDVPVINLDIDIKSRVDNGHHNDLERIFLEEPFTFIYLENYNHIA